jgi:hemin uptake protein HemP
MLNAMSGDDQTPKPGDNDGDKNAPARGLRRVSTNELMAGSREIILDHDGKEYRLRITSLGKLILTR